MVRKRRRREKIIPVPARLLCPKCQLGRMRMVDFDGGQVQIGPYIRRCQLVCKCGYSRPDAEEFYGVPAT